MANYKDKVQNILVKNLYPIVAAKLDTNSKKFIDAIGKFFNRNYKQIHDISTYENIYYNQSDIDELFAGIGLSEAQVLNIIKECYYFSVSGINPQCVKEPYVQLLMMAIRYYLKHSKQREAELCGIYLCFSGKFYASIFASA